MSDTTRKNLHQRRRKTAAWVKKAAALFVAIGVVAGGIVGAATATAANSGYGVGALTGITGWQGNMLTSDGSTYVYCTDPGTQFATGADTFAGYVTSWKGVSGNRLAGINRMLNETNPQNNTDAAAVNFVIKNTFDPDTMYTSHAYPRSASWPSGNLGRYIEWVLSTTYPSDAGGWQAVRDRALALQAVVDSTVAGSGGTGSGSLVLTMDAADNARGTVMMTGTAGSTGSITLTGGVFAATGTATMTDAAAGATYEIRGVPSSDGAPYSVSATGTFTPPGTAGYLAEIALWQNPNQNLAGKGRAATPTPFEVAGADASPRSSTFQPVLTSQAAQFSSAGELIDVLTFATAADAAGTHNTWAIGPDGVGRAVGFTVRAFGPFEAAPAEVSDIPEGVAEAGSVDVLASGTQSPVEVRIPGVTAGGYYTFVAEYNAAITPAETRAFLPADYAWRHAFGMSNETTIVPMKVQLSSQIDAAEVALAGRGDDTVIVDAEGLWLQAGGRKVPVTIAGEYIFWPAAAGPVTPTDVLPAGATVVGAVALTVSEPGRYKASSAEGFAALTAPASGEGWMTWRWSVRTGDQRADVQGRVAETAELIGDATQTQVLAQPVIATVAQAGAQPGATMGDVATVGGVLPADGLDLSFAAYSVPFGADGQPRWPGAPGDYSGFCTAENLVFDNHATPYRVQAAGDYASPAVDTTEHAMMLWVERGASVSTGATIVEGECGLLNETTYVGTVTTQAHTATGSAGTATSGDKLWDVATLTGAVPDGGAITVHLYRWTKGAAAVCTDDSRVWSSEPVALSGGMFPQGIEVDFRAHGRAFTIPAYSEDTQLGFVEVVTDKGAREVSRGRCGAASETVTVGATALPATGGSAVAPVRMIGISVGLIALGLLVFSVRRVLRRRGGSV